MTPAAAALFLRELRKTVGVTQEDFAPKIGVSRRQYIRIEKGEFFIKMDAALRALELLDAPDGIFRRLWLDEAAGKEQGKIEASRWLSTPEGQAYQSRRDRIAAQIHAQIDAAIPLEDTDEAIEDLEELAKSPRRGGRRAAGAS